MRMFCFALAVTFLGFVGSAQVRAQDAAIQVQDLPKEVVDAVRAKFPDAQLQKAKKKVVDGKPFIGVGLTSKGIHSISLTPKGKIVEHKKVIPPRSCRPRWPSRLRQLPQFDHQEGRKGHGVQGGEEFQTGSDHVRQADQESRGQRRRQDRGTQVTFPGMEEVTPSGLSGSFCPGGRVKAAVSDSGTTKVLWPRRDLRDIAGSQFG